MKKKILIIIALIMVISTIIRTAIVGFSFFNFSNQLITNQTLLIKELLQETIDKNRFIDIIKSSHHIKCIKFINKRVSEINLKYDLENKEIIAVAPFNSNEALKIVFSGKDYFDKLINAILQIVFLALISMIIIILILNYYLTPYLEILEKVKHSTEKMLKGKFDEKLNTKLKGEAKEFVDAFNDFIQKMNNSFGVIEKKYTTLIEKEKSNDPLNDAKETIEHLANIFQFKRIIEEDLDVQSILQRLIEIIKTFKISNFAIIGIDNNEKNIIFNYIQGDICCSVLENPNNCRCYRLNKEINSIKTPKVCQLHFCQNDYICLPFSSSGNFSGILKINIKDKNILKNIPYIKAYLNEISPVIEAKYTLEILHSQTIKDPLTGLFNRRYLESILPTIIASAKRREEKIGFLMIDMDYFKKVNDTYGHEAGDIVLQTLAEILKSSIRKSDIAIRYGGEEFLIILQNIKSLEDALEVAEKIRKSVENRKIHIKNNILQKTISIGVSVFPIHCNNALECIKNADTALYKAKNSGRNKVVIFKEELKTI